VKEHRAQDEFLDAKAKANILRQRMEPLPEIHDCSALENAYAELKAINFELRQEIKELNTLLEAERYRARALLASVSEAKPAREAVKNHRLSCKVWESGRCTCEPAREEEP
jgi:hypothetical protein